MACGTMRCDWVAAAEKGNNRKKKKKERRKKIHNQLKEKKKIKIKINTLRYTDKGTRKIYAKEGVCS